ncbi:MAG: hypothetical protein NTV89_01305 [Proteobacteria bacterium]|nr:hypothetical protein [Pseudomonadota bacterium]
MRIEVPEALLRLEQDNIGAWLLKTDEGVFAQVRNPAEGNFILYAQLRGQTSVTVPKEMICLFKCVKMYENYARNVQTKILAKLNKKTGQRSVAEYEAHKIMREAGLPWLHSA